MKSTKHDITINMFNKLINVVDADIRMKVIAVGVFHILFVVYGLYATIEDLILDQEPVGEDYVLYIVAHVLLQVALAGSLILGGVFDSPCLVIPWLLAAFPIFSLITFYTFSYLNFRYPVQTLVNVFFIAFYWAVWAVVFLFTRGQRRSSRTGGRTMRALFGKESPILPPNKNRAAGAEEESVHTDAAETLLD